MRNRSFSKLCAPRDRRKGFGAAGTDDMQDLLRLCVRSAFARNAQAVHVQDCVRLCAGNSLINRESRLAARHRHAKACQQSLGLMFMNIHVIPHMTGNGPPFTLVQ